VIERLRAAGCVFAEDEARLLTAAAGAPAELDAMVDRRSSGEPLEHVLGWAEFCGLRIFVDPGVFVPRRRTEFLVRQALEVAPAEPVVVDLCCGSGAVGVAIAANAVRTELHVVDIDPVAARCAHRNVVASRGRVYVGDLCEPLSTELQGRVDILVANAPYVPTDAIRLLPPEARIHESMVALDGGADGLDVQRRVAKLAARWLAPGGYLLIETSERQASQTLEAFVHNGLRARVANSAEFGATVVIGMSAAS
jgi:release factor glutamine methyltransferase